MLSEDVHIVMELDSLENSVAMNKETTNPNFNANFGEITYRLVKIQNPSFSFSLFLSVCMSIFSFLSLF
jgi:hypothetical protein